MVIKMNDTINMINVVYSQRELFMKQMQLLFNDVPDSDKVALFEKIFKLQEEERNKIKKVKENYLGDKEVLEELYIMSSYNDKLNALLQQEISLHNENNVLK